MSKARKDAPPKGGKTIGRPMKLTPELIEKIARLLRAGIDVKTAAIASGVSRASFYGWIEQAQAGKRGIYKLFLDTIEQAEAQARARLVMSWSNMADKDWRAARALLAVLDPDRYEGSTRLRVADDEPPPVKEEQRIRFFIPEEDSEAERVMRRAEEEAEEDEQAAAEEELLPRVEGRLKAG
jgi:hypothetical protein